MLQLYGPDLLDSKIQELIKNDNHRTTNGSVSECIA